MNLGPYAKTITAFVTGLIGWVTAVIQSPSTSVTATEWIALVTIIAVSLGVYAIPNKVA